ncbi:hypothetical protein HHK36_012662 [Tetracentron sinense]|uniref:Transcription repressor n=1 Tax=Tetracentron sinense TaxID=13715 RepID=A0A835DFW7_TETSI|nr:hypothetical protein HHK36_012662 [Tetracentron sinense]
MQSTLRKNIHLYFSKLKCPATAQSPSTPPPKKDHSRPSPTPKSTSILMKNFNSLFDLSSDSTSKSLSHHFSSSDSDSDNETTTPDFATVLASQRFFFSSPGHSNSIIQFPESPPESDTLIGGSVAVPTYSPDPYMDFRQSMQEMVEARQLLDVGADWDYLQELLLCYLTLNPKHSHKFIIGAFADLLVGLMTSTHATRPEPHVSGRCTVSPRFL